MLDPARTAGVAVNVSICRIVNLHYMSSWDSEREEHKDLCWFDRNALSPGRPLALSRTRRVITRQERRSQVYLCSCVSKN